MTPIGTKSSPERADNSSLEGSFCLLEWGLKTLGMIAAVPKSDWSSIALPYRLSPRPVGEIAGPLKPLFFDCTFTTAPVWGGWMLWWRMSGRNL